MAEILLECVPEHTMMNGKTTLEDKTKTATTKTTRLAKRIAESGCASRREAEELIRCGRVSVNGNTVTTPLFFLDGDDCDEISIDGIKLQLKSASTPDQVIIWKFYKPLGVVTTKKDTHGRKTVFDFFPARKQGRLLYVGRLDINSEGLLLFTNSGDLARKLELPSSGLTRIYRARIFGRLEEAAIHQLKNGVTVCGTRYGPIDVMLDGNRGTNGRTSTLSKSSSNTWATITLAEGKNLEIRRVMAHFGCQVNRLIRISYGPFVLGSLAPGVIEKVSPRDVKTLMATLNNRSDL